MTSLSAVEWDIIEARTSAVMSERGVQQRSTGFLYLVLDQLFPGRSADFSGMVTDGGNDLGVDAIEIIENDDRAEVIIVQSKHRDSMKSSSRTINESEILKISSFFECIFSKSSGILNRANFQLSQMIGRIWALHEQGIICRYRVVFCTNGSGFSPAAKSLLTDFVDRYSAAEYEFYGPKELIRDIDSAGRKRESGVLDVVGKELFERTDGDIRGVIASVDAKSFVNLIKDRDGRSVKRHLFEENIRIYLGSNGGYNPQIIKSATSHDSHLFWYLNNGITITCKDYSYNKGTVSPKIRIEEFQIVNGAQTSYSLMEAARRGSEFFDNVIVVVRIYATKRDDVAELVAVATNSQARIQSRDLCANRPVMKVLELAFLSRGYFFERKRNMYSDQDPEKRIDALKFGQIILSYYIKEPDKAKSQSDSIFGERFGSIFNETWSVDELCELYELYRVVERLRDREGDATNLGGDQGKDSSFLIYGHWFVLFAIRIILVEREKPIPSSLKEKEEIVREGLSLVARACDSLRASHYAIFRSPRTREKIEAELRGKQMSIFDLL